MIIIILLFIVLIANVETLTCPSGQLPCGSVGCYDPNIQGCSGGGSTIQCINSCNGTCYSNSQYCYNNTKVCNNGESVCNVKTYNYFSSPTAFGLNCYNSSQLICGNDTLCAPQYACGTQCLTDYNAVCVNNQTLCSGFYYWNYYPYTNRYVNICGPQKTCYDNTTSVCLNGTTVCEGLNARFCGSNCYTPDTQICTNGIVRCINSCNGTCYSNSQYCYNNTKVCNNGESVCNVKTYFSFSSTPSLGLNCYNSSQLICGNDTLCAPQYACGTQCLREYNSTCASNRTLCSGFYYWNYYPYSNRYVDVCGSQRKCYDNTTSVCFSENSTVCPIGNQLCSGVCYNPQAQYCIGGNNTIFCLTNPSSSTCPTTATTTTTAIPVYSTSISTIRTSTTGSTTSGGCCAVQNCTIDADCCEPSSDECQCFRHNQENVYGSCVNPNITPVCGNSCSIKGKCRYDSDCCKCQCAEVRFTDLNGQLAIKKQCIRR
ncbi:hypothetical protein I4U23_003580 [Adineta vaga]|nr:hypothetical protein I4U23_003580 [Adineta vaga]